MTLRELLEKVAAPVLELRANSNVVDLSSPAWKMIGATAALPTLFVAYVNRNGNHPVEAALLRATLTGVYSGLVTPWITRRMMEEVPDSKFEQFCINYEVAAPVALGEMTVFDAIGSRPGYSVLPFFLISLASPFALEWLEKRGIGPEYWYERTAEWLGIDGNYKNYLLRPSEAIFRMCGE